MMHSARYQIATQLLTFDRWEELEDKAAEGQWDYFSRDQHTGETQAPPTK